MENDLTFHPKTNKNNNLLIERFAPSMDFFERNALIKKRNEKKKLILQRERSQRMLKECSFLERIVLLVLHGLLFPRSVRVRGP